MRKLRSIIAAVALLFSAPAIAQQGIPFFPQTLNPNTVVGRLSSGPGPTEEIPFTSLLSALFPVGSAAYPFNAASVTFQGSVSGAVSVQAQAAAGTWSLRWPTNQGVTNQCLKTTASGSIATTSWANCAFLDANNTWTGTQTFNGNLTVASLANFTGTFQKNGTTQTFPASGSIAGTSDTQTLTNKSIDAGQLTGTIAVARLPGSIDTNLSTSKTADYTATSADCGSPLFLGNNTQLTLTVNAANTYSANCHLIIINTDTYSGVGTGRGKVMAINGITGHILYPGQKLDLRRNGSSWQPDQILLGAQGQLWIGASAPVFFVDAGAGSNSNDGLASGAGGAYSTLQYCINQIYSVLYDRQASTTFCKVTAGTSITEAVNLFYPKPGAGIIQITSTSGGSQFTWNCPAAGACLQSGDYSGIGLTDVSLVANATSTGIIVGHQYGVIETNANVKVTGANGAVAAFFCDFNTEFNILNGITYAGTHQLLFNACPGSQWNINGAIAASSSPNLGRFFVALGGARMLFTGNVTFTGTPTTSVALVTGGSVVNNVSGAVPPGGAPTPSGSASTGWSAYCTSTC